MASAFLAKRTCSGKGQVPTLVRRMPRSDLLTAPLNRSVESPSAGGGSLASHEASHEASRPRPQPHRAHGSHTEPIVGGLRLTRANSRASSLSPGAYEEDETDGCWERARKRNFVVLRGTAVLIVHFCVGIIGCGRLHPQSARRMVAPLCAIARAFQPALRCRRFRPAARPL